MFVLMKMNAPAGIIIFLFIIFFSSFFVIKYVRKKYFTKEILFTITEASFQIDYLNFLGESLYSDVFYFNELNSIQVTSTSGSEEMYDLSFKIKNKMKKTFSFINSENVTLLINSILLATEKYNKTFSHCNSSITISNPFLTTKNGLYLINFITFLGIAAFCIHIYINPNSSFGTLFVSFSFIFKLYSNRSKDIQLYKMLVNGKLI